jgi:hypothetical protein
LRMIMSLLIFIRKLLGFSFQVVLTVCGGLRSSAVNLLLLSSVVRRLSSDY